MNQSVLLPLSSLNEQFLPRLLLRTPRARPIPPAMPGIKESAVIIPLIPRQFGWSLLLTQRSLFLRHHPGQICFPGGKVDPGDPDLHFTALRELKEELGIEAQPSQILCRLPPILTGTGYRIHPFIAHLNPPEHLTPSLQEIAAVFEIPLRQVLIPEHFGTLMIHRNNQRRRVRGITVDGWFIWGATANILYHLAKHLR